MLSQCWPILDLTISRLMNECGCKMSYSGLKCWNCFSRLSPIFASEPGRTQKIGNITTVGILSEQWKRGNKIPVFPSLLWILSSQVWTFLRSIDGRGGCWLSGKLWGAAPQRLGAHSEWVTPLLAGDHSTHWDSRQAKQGLEQDEGDRTHPSRPMRQPDRSKGVNHLQGNCNCNYMIASSGLEAVRVFKTHLS